MEPKGFYVIPEKEIEAALAKNRRQYLAGTLKLPQEIKHLQDEDVEIGISDYKQAFEEPPHWHVKQNEYQYVLDGETDYFDVNKEKGHSFKKGDFYAVDKGTCHSQKIASKCRILFFKVPAKVYDKITCEKCGRENCKYRVKERVV